MATSHQFAFANMKRLVRWVREAANLEEQIADFQKALTEGIRTAKKQSAIQSKFPETKISEGSDAQEPFKDESQAAMIAI